MERIKTTDLCASCLSMDTHKEGTVKQMLDKFYSDPKTHMAWGEAYVLKILIETIIEGDGCTTCGEKILNRCDTISGRAR